MAPPLVVAVRMGLGHLRAAAPVAEALGVPLSRADLPPLATPFEARFWAATTEAYEWLSRRATTEGPARKLLEAITRIPEEGGPTGPDPAAWTHALAIRAGLGRRLGDAGGTVVSTFYTPALAAEHAGVPAVCVVTDTDCARVWVAPRPVSLRYAAPVDEVVSRLRDYGVPSSRIERTGFPLPLTLVANVEGDTAARVRRLRDGVPLHVVLAVGGAAAQLDQLGVLLESLPRDATAEVFVGLRPALATQLATRFPRPGVQWHGATTFEEHARTFAEALRRADVLWTKPSELSFYAALGLPLALAAPLGVQEERNRAWLQRHGVLLEPPDLAWLDRHRDAVAHTAERGLVLERGGTAGVVEMVAPSARGSRAPD